MGEMGVWWNKIERALVMECWKASAMGESKLKKDLVED